MKKEDPSRPATDQEPWWHRHAELRRLHAAGITMPAKDPASLRLPELRELEGEGPTLTELLLEDRRHGP